MSLDEEDLVRIYLKAIDGELRKRIGLPKNKTLSEIMEEAVAWEEYLRACGDYTPDQVEELET